NALPPHSIPPPAPHPSPSPLFFFNDTPTTEIYTLSLHDALPICFAEFDRSSRSLIARRRGRRSRAAAAEPSLPASPSRPRRTDRSEEHTSELQSLTNLVCRLLLEKKKKQEHECTT